MSKEFQESLRRAAAKRDPEVQEWAEKQIDDADAETQAVNEMLDIKVRENKLRRMADRQGLRLIKSRRRDPRAVDYGRYWVANDRRLMMTPEQGMDLDEIDAWLSEPDER